MGETTSCEPTVKIRWNSDPRSLLERVRDAMAVVEDATREDVEENGIPHWIIRIGDVRAAFRDAHGIKGILAEVTGISDNQRKALFKVRGTRATFRDELEVSWRGIDDFCGVLAKAMTPRALKAVAAAKLPKVVSPKALKTLEALLTGDERLKVIDTTRNGEPSICVWTEHQVEGCYASVTVGGAGVLIETPYSANAVEIIKTVPGVKWIPETKRWTARPGDIPALAQALLGMLTEMVATKREEWRLDREEQERQAYINKLRAEHHAEVRRQKEEENRVRLELVADERIRAISDGTNVPPPQRPRYPVLLSDGVREGDVVEWGDTWAVVEGFGQVFEVSENHPSMWGQRFLGEEGNPVRYAYCRMASKAECAAKDAKVAAAKVAQDAARHRASIRRTVLNAIRAEGEFVPEQRMPTGDHLVPSSKAYGCGEDLLRTEDGALWFVEYHGMDGDNWSANNLPRARGWRLAAGERATELEAML